MVQIIPCEQDELFEPTKCTLNIYSNSDTSLSSPIQIIKLRSSRISLGYGIFAQSNQFFHLSYDPGLDSGPGYLIILDVFDAELKPIQTYKASSTFSCSNLEWVLSYNSDQEYKLVLGDLCNYTEVQVLSIKSSAIIHLQTFDWGPISYNIKDVYWLASTNILVSDTVGFDGNKIGIRITNLATDTLVGNPIIFKINQTHKYSNPIEIPSKIIQTKENLYLIKIKYDIPINPLKIETKCILVLCDFKLGKIYHSIPYDKTKALGYQIHMCLPEPSIGFFKLGN